MKKIARDSHTWSYKQGFKCRVNGAVPVHDRQYFINHATAEHLTPYQKSWHLSGFLSLELIAHDTVILINFSLLLFIIVLPVCFSRVS